MVTENITVAARTVSADFKINAAHTSDASILNDGNNENAIETLNLTRSFGNITAVKDVSILVPRGCVYGFLGPNGSGKTTTIRMLLGLIRPDKGEVKLFDTSLERERKSLLSKVGSLIESPSLYGHLTGRENLEVTRRLLAVGRKHIDRVLAIVRLEKAANRPVRGYSLGMRQRLGLALAMLGEPELLILDEPTNGLDPAGIHEMRDLIRRLPEEHGATVFLSSHLLSEIEQIATRIGIINNGRLLFQGTLDDLQAQRRERITLKVNRPTEAMEILANNGWRVERDDSLLAVAAHTPNEAAIINRTLVCSGLDVSHLSLERLSLEEIFLNLTGAVEGAKDE